MKVSNQQLLDASARIRIKLVQCVLFLKTKMMMRKKRMMKMMMMTRKVRVKMYVFKYILIYF